MVLRRKEVYTVITPIPGFIPRQLAIDILHSHSEVITLNPLVTDHRQCKAPRDAASDEFFSTWYEITERIQYVPGLGRLGAGTINFKGCFHDLPWGLQTHTYAPANCDLRSKYRIAGNQPGVEPPEPPEIGLAELGAPKDGLYLREDIEIKCNITLMGIVKAQMKAASKEMVARIIKKAELLDAGVLQAMIEQGKLRTINPRDATYTGGLSAGILHQQQQAASSSGSSPGLSPVKPCYSPPPVSPSIPYQVPRPISLQQQSRPGSAGSQSYPAHWQQQHQQHQQNPYELSKVHQHAVEAPNNEVLPAHQQVMELPGDMAYYPSHQPATAPPYQRHSSASSNLSQSQTQSQAHLDPRWSQSQPSPSAASSRPTSLSSNPGSTGFASPGLSSDHKTGASYASELPSHKETHEEHRVPVPPPKLPFKPYNPADYNQLSH